MVILAFSPLDMVRRASSQPLITFPAPTATFNVCSQGIPLNFNGITVPLLDFDLPEPARLESNTFPLVRVPVYLN